MRLTEKENHKSNYEKEHCPQYAINTKDNSNIGICLMQILNKLGQLEDIEEQLGIDLITLYKESPLQLKALATLTKEELL